MKRPKKKWQIDVRSQCDALGIGYRELSELTNISVDMIRQAMSKDNVPAVRDKLCDYLEIQIEEGIEANV